MARAQALLALTATPPTMPCRDNERAAITSFVQDSLSAGQWVSHTSTPALLLDNCNSCQQHP